MIAAPSRPSWLRHLVGTGKKLRRTIVAALVPEVVRCQLSLVASTSPIEVFVRMKFHELGCHPTENRPLVHRMLCPSGSSRLRPAASAATLQGVGRGSRTTGLRKVDYIDEIAGGTARVKADDGRRVLWSKVPPMTRHSGCPVSMRSIGVIVGQELARSIEAMRTVCHVVLAAVLLGAVVLLGVSPPAWTDCQRYQISGNTAQCADPPVSQGKILPYGGGADPTPPPPIIIPTPAPDR
jgi:hypothetical protein